VVGKRLATLHEVEVEWSVDDLVEAGLYLDAVVAMENLASKEANERMERTRHGRS